MSRALMRQDVARARRPRWPGVKRRSVRCCSALSLIRLATWVVKRKESSRVNMPENFGGVETYCRLRNWTADGTFSRIGMIFGGKTGDAGVCPSPKATLRYLLRSGASRAPLLSHRSLLVLLSHRVSRALVGRHVNDGVYHSH